jgi:hypothetical protein
MISLIFTLSIKLKLNKAKAASINCLLLSHRIKSSIFVIILPVATKNILENLSLRVKKL